MYNHQLYFWYWVISAVVLGLMGRVFPGMVELGSGRFNAVESAVYAGFWMTFFVWTMWDFMIVKKARLEPASVSFSYFFLVNVVGVMVVSQFSAFTGMRAEGFWAAVGIGLVTNLLQRWTWRMVVARKMVR